jgi:hypothetical protein
MAPPAKYPEIPYVVIRMPRFDAVVIHVVDVESATEALLVFVVRHAAAFASGLDPSGDISVCSKP